MACKANSREVVERLRLLYERRGRDRIFATFAVSGAGAEVMSAFRAQHPEGPCEYPDPAERIVFWNQLFGNRPQVSDDSLPSAYLTEMDQGLYGGLLGADVHFNCNPENGWISSMVAPVLQDWSGFEKLPFTTSHPLFERYKRQLEIFAAGADGKFGICPCVQINGLNFIIELVGAMQTYTSLLDSPDAVRQGIELGFRINAAVADAFFEHIPRFDGGTFNLGGQWLSGRSVMESVDPFHMTSSDCFEEWGREPLERMFARYDGGEIHLHGNGRHLLPAVLSVAGLKAIQLGDDTGCPSAFSLLEVLRVRAGEMPLIVSVDYRDFAEALERHRLCGGVLYHVRGAPDAASAERCMEKVRSYRE